MFDFDRARREVIDPDDGATMRTTFGHWHATHQDQGIFHAEGKLIFKASFRSYSVDVPLAAQEIDPPGQRALLEAWEYDHTGRATPVYGDHPQLARLIDYWRRSLESKDNVERFVLIDLRKKAQH